MRLQMKFKRMEKGLSQKQLAEIVGVHFQSISDYETERANPSYGVMKKIADTLDSTVDEIFYKEVE